MESIAILKIRLQGIIRCIEEYTDKLHYVVIQLRDR